MISKRIGIAPQNDNYARLANYIADAGHKGEKALLSWCAGCFGGDDYAEGIAEVLDTQDMNTRTTQAKTYHLIVSFRPEDEARFTPELFQAIEKRFAEALGYAEHQRHCGVHKNTANLHLHVAYSMIHPEKGTWHKEFRDFWIRDRVCRELEREYGLHIDHGREQAVPGRERLGDKAAQVESHTGQESFESYAARHKEAIMAALPGITDWKELHETLARFGMEIKPHGNGLALKDRHGKHAVKASALDRSLSMKRLEARFGLYQPSSGLDQVQEHSRYQAPPLHRSPERGDLYAEYRRSIEDRKVRLQAAKEKDEAALAAIRAEWAAKRREIERMGIAKKNRRNLLALARKHEAESIARAKLELLPEREAVRRDIPFTTWSGFLKHKAEQGNETALAVLRSGKENVEPDQVLETPGNWTQHGREQFSLGKEKIRAEYAARERAALETEGITGKGRNRLLAVLRMESLAAEERQAGQPALIAGFQHEIDHKGTVIFTLPGGGVIRDSGKELFFSGNDEVVHHAAVRYAQKKWGKNLRIEGNKIVRLEKELVKAKVKEQRHHLGR
jgi:hypothetical protein